MVVRCPVCKMTTEPPLAMDSTLALCTCKGYPERHWHVFCEFDGHAIVMVQPVLEPV